MNETNPSPFPQHDLDDPFATEARLRVGYSPAVRAAFDSTVTGTGLEPLRVARVDAEGCTLLGGDAPLRAKVLAKTRRRSPPVVGDWVAVRERRGDLLVWQRLERQGTLQRRAAGSAGEAQVLAANLDLVLICTGLDRDFRLARIERWLSLVHESGARPVVVLTKAGLVTAQERTSRVAEVRALGSEFEVLAIDVIDGVGLTEFDLSMASPHPWARAIALVGSSGVGKSTLLNHLAGRGHMTTGAVSRAHGKGRHTTSHRELFTLPGRNLVVVDTPGLREVGLWGDGSGVQQTFADIVELASGCRFADCQHEGEPGCAVRCAIEAGELDPRRVESMRRLDAEQAATARRRSEHERRAHERDFSRMVNAFTRAKRYRRGG